MGRIGGCIGGAFFGLLFGVGAVIFLNQAGLLSMHGKWSTRGIVIGVVVVGMLIGLLGGRRAKQL